MLVRFLFYIVAQCHCRGKLNSFYKRWLTVVLSYSLYRSNHFIPIIYAKFHCLKFTWCTYLRQSAPLNVFDFEWFQGGGRCDLSLTAV
jgi:hypothetical protein